MTGRFDPVVGWAYSAGGRVVRSLPESLAVTAFDRGADLATARRGPGVVQLARNLRRVLGDQATPESLHAAVSAGVRSYARYWRETFRLPSMDADEVARRSVAGTIGLEHVRAAVESGRGVVLALPHSGNWDVAGLMLCQVFGTMTTVAELLEPEAVYQKFLAFRRGLGMEVLPLTGGSATSQILKERLRQGKVVCLLGDRDLTASGVPVDFFGEATRMPAGPAMLAAVTGADLCPAHLTYSGDGWRNLIGPPLQLPGDRLAQQVRGGTQLLADHFAEHIARDPADWHMMQPLWPADLARVDPATAGRPGNPR